MLCILLSSLIGQKTDDSQLLIGFAGFELVIELLTLFIVLGNLVSGL